MWVNIIRKKTQIEKIYIFSFVSAKQEDIRDVKVSRPAWSRDHFFGLGLGLGLGLTVIGLGLDLGLMR